jgi:hypothetical protein
MAQQLTLPQLDVSREALARQRRGLIADLPRARTTDPETSHEAGDAIRASGELGRQQTAVLEAVRRWPGLTSLELGARMKLDRWAIARRLPELETARKVWRDGTRVINGRRHTQWWPV